MIVLSCNCDMLCSAECGTDQVVVAKQAGCALSLLLCADQQQSAGSGLPAGLEFADSSRLLGSGKKPGEVIVVKEDAGAIAYTWGRLQVCPLHLLALFVLDLAACKLYQQLWIHHCAWVS